MANGDLDALVRRVDEDRWLASRFAPADVRARLIAVYAVDYELARISQLVREPAAGVLRLAWWRDALADTHAGRPTPTQPTLQFYAEHAVGIPGAGWNEIIEARAAEFEPFISWDAFDAFAEQTAGGVFKLTVEAGGADERDRSAADALRAPASRAWGYVGALLAGRALPGTREEALSRAARAYADVRLQARDFPPSLFPAFGFVALTAIYLRSLSRGRTKVALLHRQLRLISAAATGRL